uniref:HDC03960 n=1 Tax=Drosophila melanogaster TaxID=7227 RepID=Q6IH02_DROME|nr:TPA_inf: HDC03960 [Drosophila melanogaster]
MWLYVGPSTNRTPEQSRWTEQEAEEVEVVVRTEMAVEVSTERQERRVKALNMAAWSWYLGLA